MRYRTTVNNQTFEIEIGHDGEITIDGETYEVDFERLSEGGLLSLLIGPRSLEAIVEARDGEWEVLLKGELYSVDVQDERAYRLARARGMATTVTGEAIVKSPMPGVILDVRVREGERVAKGDQVVILESMKMENELRAPRDGVILRVGVAAGASVEKDQMLVVIGDAPEEE